MVSTGFRVQGLGFRVVRRGTQHFCYGLCKKAGSFLEAPIIRITTFVGYILGVPTCGSTSFAAAA